ncbi:MAG: hypothetical protein CUN55_12955 [Phototrophicales bacterium]|nr:MAG: hypothetical protein CUN55_12955 [Phototrophicales bacterium]
MNWELIGEIVLIQIQLRPIKLGEIKRVYAPKGCLQTVDSITLQPEGITTYLNDQVVYDVHHRHHPQSRYRQSNAVSFGFTSHYEKMKARFGENITLGVAAENIIVQSNTIWAESDFANGVAIQNNDGERVLLDGIFAIPPCKPFTAFCMGEKEVDDQRQTVKENLQFLFDGTRGFCAELAQPITFQVQIGDTLWRAIP